uniref:Uncharacterized protein n=1 Tax=Rhizophora mucronata TaxID=61149 RepID=A0A2P2PVI3_RHIMU
MKGFTMGKINILEY